MNHFAEEFIEDREGALRDRFRSQAVKVPTAAARSLLSVGSMKLLIFIGLNVGGYAGWSLGEQFGGVMTAFFVSSLGSALGVYAGWWLARRYLR